LFENPETLNEPVNTSNIKQSASEEAENSVKQYGGVASSNSWQMVDGR
jgi:hypothetical protein